MPNVIQPDWQFEHAMTTMFVCRSVIKYNSMLSDAQKQELIHDIDQSLQFLRCSSSSVSPSKMEKSITQDLQAPRVTLFPTLQEKGDHDERAMLCGLYQMYYKYLEKDSHKDANSFATRFNDAMSALNEIQTTLEQHGVPGIADVRPLDHVCAFIADLYYVFVEFIRSLSEILDANDIYVETEELSAGQECFTDSETISKSHRLALLYRIYEANQSLNTKYGPINQRVQEAKAFLGFLEEAMCSDMKRYEGFMIQFSCVSRLLNDLAVLVAGYERATSMLLR